MWTYNKTLQYPINIKCTDPKLAKVIISQYGGAYSICYYSNIQLLYCNLCYTVISSNSLNSNSQRWKI